MRREQAEGRLRLLSEPIELFDFDFRSAEVAPNEKEPRSFDVKVEGHSAPNAVLFYFMMDLGAGQTLSNSPFGERVEGCHWLQAVRYCSTAAATSTAACTSWSLTVALDGSMSDICCQLAPISEEGQQLIGEGLPDTTVDPQWAELRQHTAMVGENLAVDLAQRPQWQGAQVAQALAAQKGR